jgi:hypothetical protein
MLPQCGQASTGGHAPVSTLSTLTPATLAPLIASPAPGRPRTAQAFSITFGLTLSASASRALPPRRILKNRSASRTFACSCGVRSDDPVG